MKQFCLNLNKDLQRPTIVLKGISAMIDTEASRHLYPDDDKEAIVKFYAEHKDMFQ